MVLMICYCLSYCHHGRVYDNTNLRESGFLEKTEETMRIMADKRYA
jgi:hypothetical protein